MGLKSSFTDCLMSFALIGLALVLHCGRVRTRKRCRECYRKLDPKLSKHAASLIENGIYTNVNVP